MTSDVSTREDLVRRLSAAIRAGELYAANHPLVTRSLDNLLAVTAANLVKSEIVVPIFVKDKLAGELDIESYFASTFTPPEQEFVEGCAKVVGKYLGKSL